MKIAVCVSHVPDTATRINLSADGKTIDPTGVSFVLNPYDEFAIEEALLKREDLGGEVIAITVGRESTKEALKKAIAMGVDDAVLLKTDSELDSIATAKILAAEIKDLQAELVFMGKQSVDYDNSITGQLTAALLNFNSVSTVVDLKIDGTKVLAEREIEGGREVVETTLPAVISAQKGLNTPRFPSMKGIMAAKKKPVSEKDIEVEKLKTKILVIKKPPPKQPGRIIGSDSSAVKELIRLLKDEAKVI